jgi:hypothetical protein
MVRRDKDSMWVEGRNSPFQGPTGAGRWVTGCTWDAVRVTWKEVAGRVETLKRLNWPGAKSGLVM